MDGSTLVFIKTKNTGSGKVELFEIPGPNYQSPPTGGNTHMVLPRRH
jgi:hypothetical protein